MHLTFSTRLYTRPCLKNIKLLKVEQFVGLRVMVLKVDTFPLDAELSPLEEASAKPSDQIIIHLTIEVIHHVLQV